MQLRGESSMWHLLSRVRGRARATSGGVPPRFSFFGSVAAEIWGAKAFLALVLEFWRRVSLTYFPGISFSIGFAVGG